MDDNAAHVHDNPLFSPTFRVRCWDVREEKGESNKKTPKNTPKKTPKKSPKKLEKNASSIEVEMDLSSNLSISPGMTRDSNSGSERHTRRPSIIEDDREWEGLGELRMKVRRYVEIQEEENNEISYPGSPVIIQAGGVASYHPLYSPSAPRPRFLRYGVSPPESPRHKQRSETKSRLKVELKEEAEKEAEKDAYAEKEVEKEAEKDAYAEKEVEKEAEQCHNGEKSEVIEEYPEEPPSLEDPRSEITTGDKEQPQEGFTKPDDTSKPNTNSLSTHRSTNGLKNPKTGICVPKKMLPLLLIFLLTAAASDIVLVDNNYMKPLPLTEGVNLSQKMKGFFFLLWEPVPSEHMGRIKNSSSAFVGRLADSFYHCSCSSISYLKSYKGSTTEKIWAEFINFCKRLMDIFFSFCHDKLFSTRAAAGENQEFCKCFNSNQSADPMNLTSHLDSSMSENTTVDTHQASKDETNQRIQDNSSTSPIQEEATTFTIDVNHVHPEYNDQYFEQISEVYETDESQGSECSSPKVSKAKRVHFNPVPLEFPVAEEAFKTISPGVVEKFVDKNSPGIKWKRFILVATAMTILLIFICGILYLGWCMAQKMELRNPRQRNNPRQRRQQNEQSSTPSMLGSFVQYSSEPAPNAVRRSVRIRNKSLSPLPAQPTFTSPSSGHSFS